MSDMELIKYYQGLNMEENESSRDLGPCGKFCPFTYYTDEKLVEGSLEHVTLYRVILERNYISIDAHVEYINLPC